MDAGFADLDHAVPLQPLLGYLNFSEGKPDPRFQRQLNDAYAFLAKRGDEKPWRWLARALYGKLQSLKAASIAAFQDSAQAAAVVHLTFDKLLFAYRDHHEDLLFHLPDRDLLQPFFLARVLEAVLSQGSPWSEQQRIVDGALKQLNDFVGYRPVAVLESRPRGEPYDHERVRPIPLYLRGAGVAWGQFREMLEQTLQVLAETPTDLLFEAGFDPELLDEFAVDPRAYDQSHPANRRPNFAFGEWDPHHLDNQGRFRRYVARELTLDALLHRVEHPGKLDRAEALHEAAVVLAGTILMASGTTGGSPTAYDSSVTLAVLVPRIARYRDAFYAHFLKTAAGPHGERLRREAEALRQPFGGARQHLNQYLARNRALQLQQRQLALIFSQIGYAEAGRREAACIPTASVRILAEIVGQLIAGRRLCESGNPADAAPLLEQIDDLLRRGIACGALVDPWNVLGFQAMFPLHNAQEDSLRDHRIDELTQVMGHYFDLYARVMSEAAATGQPKLVTALKPAMRRLVSWWDRFATVEVKEVAHVHGAEALVSAEHVADAMLRWRQRGEASGDLAFWRDQLEGFHSPKAFALVIDALLEKKDHRASMALLMTWLNQAEHVSLEEGAYSFHTYALRWMLGVTTPPPGVDTVDPQTWPLVKKFLDYLEANADDYWHVPTLESSEQVAETDDEPEDLYSAAYENVTYQDSTDDDNEGAVLDGGPPQQEFDLEAEADQLGKRLRFLSTVARLWQIAAQWNPSGMALPTPTRDPQREAVLASWLGAAQSRLNGLLALLDALHTHPVPEPLGSFDSLVEFDRRRGIKEHLLYGTIGTCLDTFLAIGTLEGMVGDSRPPSLPKAHRPQWEPLVIQLERAFYRGDAAAARQIVPQFVKVFQNEALLFKALADGGEPRQILRVRIAQNVLRALASTLPRLGLLRETFHLLKTARAMEQANKPDGRGVTAFDPLFHAGYQAVIAALVEAAPSWRPQGASDRELVGILEKISRPFVQLWGEHSQSMLLSALELIRSDDEWRKLGRFVQRYGGDLFHSRFMILGNLRGILHRGVGPYLDYLAENPDPLHPIKLLDDLDRTLPRQEAEKLLQCILQAVVENYEEYKDYNTSTTQSDYGENLHVLLDFLRLKASYNRHDWNLRPLVLTHEILARKERMGAALLWQKPFEQFTRQISEQHLEALRQLEQRHGLRLRTIADRVQERFVKPLALDRLCALIRPAMEQADKGESGPAFARLQDELKAFTTQPVGVGLDIPEWLRRLEAEVQQVGAAKSAVVELVEDHFRPPKVTLSFADLQQQLEEWEKPII